MAGTQWGYVLIEDALTCPPCVTVDPVRTIDLSPGLSGTVDDPAAKVTVEVAGSNYEAINRGDGSWYLPKGLVGPLATGTYEVTVTAIDARGNIGIDATSDELRIVLLAEEFGQGLTGWTPVDQGTKARPSRWVIEQGRLIQRSNIYGRSEGLPRPGTFLIHDQGMDWTDYQVELTIMSEDDDDMGLMFRVTDGTNYYRFSWNRQVGYRRLVKCINGSFTLLASDQVPYQVGQQYQVLVKAHGPILQVFVDGRLALSAVDQSLASGTIALYCWGNQGTYFDELIVEDLTGQNIPPVITAVSVEPGIISDRQTAIVKVQASYYDGDESLLTYAWTCQQGALLDPDLAETVYVPADVDGFRTVMLQVEVSDGVETACQTIEVGVLDADAEPLLVEDFEDGDIQGWSVVNDGSWLVRPRWVCSGGAIIETSGAARRNDGIDARGTYVVYKGGSQWSDYVVSLQLCSRDTRDLGLMFRYSDGNYYRFSWNSRSSYARLVRRLGARFELLTTVGIKYIKGKTYSLTIVAKANQIRLYVDGILLMAYQDDLLTAGTIALYSSGNKGSVFDQVEVYPA
jgi:hypothetical protein